MNNDTPQIFSEDEHDYPPEAGSFPEHDGDAFPAFRGWAGWGDRVEPVAPDDDYPRPSFSPYSHEPTPYEPTPYEPTLYEPEYPQRPGSGHPGQPGYPQGPGYAPDSSYARRLGYPQDPQDDRNLGYAPDVSYAPDVGYASDADYAAHAEYAPEVSYRPDHGYTADLGFAEDPGYTGDLGFGRDPGLVPLMEPLPDPQEQAAASAWPQEQAAAAAWPQEMPPPQNMPLPVMNGPLPVMNGPLPTRVPPVVPDDRRAVWDEAFFPPPQAADPEYVRETSDSLTTESLLHGKRAAPGSGWRRSVYRATGGLLRFGESAAEMRRRDLINRIRTPVAGGITGSQCSASRAAWARRRPRWDWARRSPRCAATGS